MFNYVCNESMNCQLVLSGRIQDKIQNWNRINMQICYNYFQQEFYFLPDTVAILASGMSEEKVCRALNVLFEVSAQQKGIRIFRANRAKQTAQEPI